MSACEPCVSIPFYQCYIQANSLSHYSLTQLTHSPSPLMRLRIPEPSLTVFERMLWSCKDMYRSHMVQNSLCCYSYLNIEVGQTVDTLNTRLVRSSTFHVTWHYIHHLSRVQSSARESWIVKVKCLKLWEIHSLNYSLIIHILECVQRDGVTLSEIIC